MCRLGSKMYCNFCLVLTMLNCFPKRSWIEHYTEYIYLQLFVLLKYFSKKHCSTERIRIPTYQWVCVEADRSQSLRFRALRMLWMTCGSTNSLWCRQLVLNKTWGWRFAGGVIDGSLVEGLIRMQQERGFQKPYVLALLCDVGPIS